MDLHKAAATGDVETLKTLLQSTNYINVKDSEGFTALMRAIQAGHHTTADILLDAKCDPNITKGDSNQLLDSVLKRYKYHLRNKPTPENLGTTALHIGSSEGHEHCVRNLIKYGASLNIQNGKGETPLIKAVQGKHYDVLDTLLKSGADMEVKTWTR